jgi:hypothetical protein
MKLDLNHIDLGTHIWRRIREGLVAQLWLARGNLENDLSDADTLRYRERVRLIKELLSVDPNNTDYMIKPRVSGVIHPEFSAGVFDDLPEEVAIDGSPLLNA